MIFNKWIDKIFGGPPQEKPLVAHFYMRSGQIITVGNVKSVKVGRAGTGQYDSYQIEWVNPALAPNLFTLSIPDIIAVIVQEE